MSGAAIGIVLPAALANDESVTWAAGELQQALAARDLTSSIGQPGDTFTVAVASPGDDLPGVTLPCVAEAMALVRDGKRITAWGHDTRGLVYALTELADRARTVAGDDPFAGTFPLIEQPTARIRSIARLFCSEEEDKG